MSPWVLIIFFLAGWLSALSGVALGGWLVYRTKRDSYEPFFTAGRNAGEAFNIEDDFGQVPDKNVELPKATEMANDAFVKQFAEDLAGKAGK